MNFYKLCRYKRLQRRAFCIRQISLALIIDRVRLCASAIATHTHTNTNSMTQHIHRKVANKMCACGGGCLSDAKVPPQFRRALSDDDWIEVLEHEHGGYLSSKMCENHVCASSVAGDGRETGWRMCANYLYSCFAHQSTNAPRLKIEKLVRNWWLILTQCVRVCVSVCVRAGGLGAIYRQQLVDGLFSLHYLFGWIVVLVRFHLVLVK